MTADIRPIIRALGVLAAVAIALSACGTGEVVVNDDTAQAATPPPTATAAPEARASAVPTEVAAEIDEPDRAESTPTPLPVPTATPLPEPTVAPTTQTLPSSPRTVEVSYRVDGAGVDAYAIELTADIDGSFRSVSFDATEVFAFDASTGMSTSWVDTGDGGTFVAASVGAGLGGPDPTPSPFLPGVWYAEYVLAAGDAGALEVVDVLGRSAYRLDTAVVPNGIGGGPDRVEVSVDVETGIVLAYRAWEGSTTTATLEADSVETSDVRADVYQLDASADDLGEPWDTGFFSASLDSVQDEVGYSPSVPANVPPGYELIGVKVQPGMLNNYTGAEASNPVSTDVLQLRYSNGWRAFVVTTRRTVEPPVVWIDPFSGEGQVYETELYRLTDGTFAFTAAEVGTSAESVPHLWAANDDLVLTISGSLTTDDMLAIAQSLTPE